MRAKSVLLAYPISRSDFGYRISGIVFRIRWSLRRNLKRFRGGLIFKPDRLLHHSTLGLRVMEKKKKVGEAKMLTFPCVSFSGNLLPESRYSKPVPERRYPKSTVSNA